MSTRTLLIYLIVSVNFALTCCAQKMLKFKKTKIADTTYEAASIYDVDKDGNLDIVSGEYWFPGPDFTKRIKICDVQKEGDYYDDFSDYPMDVDGDGYLDIVTGGWWGKTLRWRENPKGQPIIWKVHDIDNCGSIERPCFWDIDGDGTIEVVPNLYNDSLNIYKLITDSSGKPTGKFSKYVIRKEPQRHGLGFGDINGDGRGDFVLAEGWLEAPADPLKGQWIWHPEFNLGRASDPILVYDVDSDGLADLIVGQAHDYGLYWLQQTFNAGKRTWVKHDIDTTRSQYHDLALADIDNDGRPELITGKRYWAHCGNDPGERDNIGIYYFEIDAGKFKCVTIDYGPPTQASGVGIYFWIADIDGNGWKDILAPGKQGLYLFKNLGLK